MEREKLRERLWVATLLASVLFLGGLLLPPLARAQVERLKLQVDGVT